MKNTSEYIPIITIDGPSGSGKGTLCHLLAERLGFHMLDSGVLYRVLAFAAHQAQIPLNDEKRLVELSRHLVIECIPKPHGLTQVTVNQQDVSKELRTEVNGDRASQVSALPAVRSALLDKQREFARWPGLVTDGRDMGTVVFPEAALKIFLLASVEERARRRFEQLKIQGVHVTLAQVLNEMNVRDLRDEVRAVSPLMPAEDAVILDTTALSIDEVVEKVILLAKERFL
jgi:CMP/dCMP kinase